MEGHGYFRGPCNSNRGSGIVEVKKVAPQQLRVCGWSTLERSAEPS